MINYQQIYGCPIFSQTRRRTAGRGVLGVLGTWRMTFKRLPENQRPTCGKEGNMVVISSGIVGASWRFFALFLPITVND